jgi:hypothetical protein
LAAGLIDRQWVGTAVGFGLDVGYPDILGAAAIREDYLTVGVESLIAVGSHVGSAVGVIRAL